MKLPSAILRSGSLILSHERGPAVGERRDELRAIGQRCHHFCGCKVETCGLSSVIVRSRALRRLPVPVRRVRRALLRRERRLLSIAARSQREAHRARDRRAPVPPHTYADRDAARRLTPASSKTRSGSQADRLSARRVGSRGPAMLAGPSADHVGSSAPTALSGPLAPTDFTRECIPHPGPQIARRRPKLGSGFCIGGPEGDTVC